MSIILRSEKGSFLSFEEVDQNFLESRTLIDDYESFVTNQYQNHVDNYNAFKISTDFELDNHNASFITINQTISDIDDAQIIQDDRLDTLELKVLQSNINHTYTKRSSNFNAIKNTRYSLNASASFTINLPVSVVDGDIIELFVTDGDQGTNPIVVDGNSNNIEGAASLTISSSKRRLMLFFNGTQWITSTS
jgi:hypothetical protein